ncbi:MAG: UDP-N-acetylmuramoyl-L-alanyl-D-glutamate--2,6-diaminopimelate ligase [Planctomycetes bacterium]|nr:UDP-N-acetylmuramoyl-L-alanyl-D-glutamate--2,6-diaminopimelate ligase [Planctomycetota bacterium]
MAVPLSVVVEGIAGERHAFREVEIRGVTCDSRQVQEGFLFVAIPGDKDDGRRFMHDAVHRGAAAVVAQKPLEERADVPMLLVRDARAALADAAGRFYGSPTRKLNVVGVTGTKGKSTTTYLSRAIHEAAGERVGLLGTIQYALGQRVQAAPMTTPPADELQRYFADMVAAGCKTAVMEVSSHALAQQRARAVRFAAGIFTNFAHDHLDYHKTKAEYRAAKARLFAQLPDHAIAALNADDASYGYFARRTKARVVGYGLDPKLEAHAEIERITFSGTRLRLTLGTEAVSLRSRLVGRHNVYNILAASAAAWGMGYDLEHIKAGIEGMTAVPGRLEPVDAGQDFAVFVDYAHTEDSLRNVLSALRPLTPGRLIAVFGCGGDRDRAKRPKMGAVAEELADFFVLTSDNPRTEDPVEIIRQIEIGTQRSSKHVTEPDRYAAIRLAISMARKDDTILIAGKGHETVQIIGPETRPFDDRAVAREILGETVRTRHD